MNLVDMKLSGYISGGIFMISGQQHRNDSRASHSVNRTRRVLPQRIGESQKSAGPAVDGDEDHRTASLAVPIRFLRHLLRNRDAFLLQQLRISR